MEPEQWAPMRQKIHTPEYADICMLRGSLAWRLLPASTSVQNSCPLPKHEITLGTQRPLGEREIEKFVIRQPPKGEKDDYDSESSWISDGLPSSSRRRRRGDGR